jgi:predicted alpha/beta hydrolase
MAYTGVKDLYLPDNAKLLNEAGYVVLAFDYKGWGASEGPRSRFPDWRAGSGQLIVCGAAATRLMPARAKPRKTQRRRSH